MCINILKQLWNILLLVHHNGVVHRDVKAENILYNPMTNKIKLFDFGCAEFKQVKFSNSYFEQKPIEW